MESSLRTWLIWLIRPYGLGDIFKLYVSSARKYSLFYIWREQNYGKVGWRNCLAVDPKQKLQTKNNDFKQIKCIVF